LARTIGISKKQWKKKNQIGNAWLWIYDDKYFLFLIIESIWCALFILIRV
jgi:hypothetical protein